MVTEYWRPDKENVASLAMAVRNLSQLEAGGFELRLLRIPEPST
jgi:hypothetical protein